MGDLCGCGAKLGAGHAVCRTCLEKARENYASIHTGGAMVHFDVTAAPSGQDHNLAVRVSGGAKRSKRYRWSAPRRARVIHPRFGEAVVPCRSKLAAMECAAEVFGCAWTDLGGAEVLAT